MYKIFKSIYFENKESTRLSFWLTNFGQHCFLPN